MSKNLPVTVNGIEVVSMGNTGRMTLEDGTKLNSNDFANDVPDIEINGKPAEIPMMSSKPPAPLNYQSSNVYPPDSYMDETVNKALKAHRLNEEEVKEDSNVSTIMKVLNTRIPNMRAIDTVNELIDLFDNIISAIQTNNKKQLSDSEVIAVLRKLTNTKAMQGQQGSTTPKVSTSTKPQIPIPTVSKSK
jgi:hypothetical protein